MISKASGRSALILLAGLGICLAGPLRATEGDASPPDTATAAPDKPIVLNKFTKHHRTHVASAKSHKSAKAEKKDTDKAAPPAVDADTAKNAAPAASADTLNASDTTAKMPDSVANANAQWPAASATPQMPVVTAQTAAANAVPGVVDTVNEPNTPPAVADAQPAVAAQIAPSDEVNDLDLAASDSKPSDGKSADAQPTDVKPALTLASATIDSPAVVTSGSSTLDQTSLIGKIFIAFGGLLTVASAARMLIA